MSSLAGDGRSAARSSPVRLAPMSEGGGIEFSQALTLRVAGAAIGAPMGHKIPSSTSVFASGPV